MHFYEGLIVNSDKGFIAVILKLNTDPEPCCDTVMEFQTYSEVDANIWLDDELNRLTYGKGIWDV